MRSATAMWNNNEAGEQITSRGLGVGGEERVKRKYHYRLSPTPQTPRPVVRIVFFSPLASPVSVYRLLSASFAVTF